MRDDWFSGWMFRFQANLMKLERNLHRGFVTQYNHRTLISYLLPVRLPRHTLQLARYANATSQKTSGNYLQGPSCTPTYLLSSLPSVIAQKCYNSPCIEEI